jgi:hypothetical protein
MGYMVTILFLVLFQYTWKNIWTGYLKSPLFSVLFMRPTQVAKIALACLPRATGGDGSAGVSATHVATKMIS